MRCLRDFSEWSLLFPPQESITRTEEVWQNLSWEAALIEASDVQICLKTRPVFSYKGDYGHALLLAGSYTRAGASVLSAQATLRMGAGLLTVSVPQENVNILQTSVPEAMLEIQNTYEPHFDKYSAVGVGPAWGIGEQKSKELRSLIDLCSKNECPMVLDADALTLLAEQRDLLENLPAQSILTPHQGELKRLVGPWKDSVERIGMQQVFSDRYKVVVVGKGAFSSLTCPKLKNVSAKVAFNTTGNPGMATAGSGDVLTGFILGLLAQGYAAEDAARAGVYLHGLAGDLAAEEIGEFSLMAGDIIRYLPKAIKRVKSEKI